MVSFQEYTKYFICGEGRCNFANHLTEEGHEMGNSERYDDDFT